MRSLPNLLTLSRILGGLALTPLMVWPGGGLWWAALALFILAALTDFLDGALARALNAESALGRMLDPLADKVIVMSALTGLALAGTIHGFHGLAIVLILAREVLIAGARDFLAQTGHALPVSHLAKWKTTAQLVAVGVLIFASASGVLGTHAVGLGLLWLATVLTLWTGFDYARIIHRVTHTPSTEAQP